MLKTLKIRPVEGADVMLPESKLDPVEADGG